jgi:hydrogenase-4 component F
MSEFLVISSTFSRQPALALLLVAGLLLALGALLLRLQDLAFGEVKGETGPVQASYVPLAVHIALVLLAGIYLPGPLVAWFQHVAQMLG